MNKKRKKKEKKISLRNKDIKVPGLLQNELNKNYLLSKQCHGSKM